MLRFGETKVTKENFYAAKKPIKFEMLMLIIQLSQNQLKQKLILKYLIGYLDKGIRPSVLIMPTMSGYVKTFQVKDEDKDKNYKLMLFRTDDEKLLEKFKAIWTKIENFKILNKMLYQSMMTDIYKPKYSKIYNKIYSCRR